MIFLVFSLYLFAAVTVATMFLPKDPEETTLTIVFTMLGKITRIAVFVFSAVFLTSAYL